MKKLIVTADDFGYTKSINEGIVRSATDGIVTDIAVMVMTDREDLEHGIALLKEHNLTEIGLHTSLFPWNKSKRPGRLDFINFFRDASDQEIEAKAMAEIAIFESLFGHPPKFISPQYNIHGNLRLLKVLAGYVVKNNIPMRIPRAVLTHDEIEDNNYSAEVFLKRLNVKMSNHLLAHILGSDAKLIINQFLSELGTVKDSESVEIILHPGYLDQDILESSSLNFERARDLSISLNQDFKKQILKLGYEFSHMSAL